MIRINSEARLPPRRNPSGQPSQIVRQALLKGSGSRITSAGPKPAVDGRSAREKRLSRDATEARRPSLIPRSHADLE